MTLTRLNKLRNMLVSNACQYYKMVNSPAGLSSRMYGWINEYNEVRFEQYSLWEEYCAQHKSHIGHDAFDLFA